MMALGQQLTLLSTLPSQCTHTNHHNASFMLFIIVIHTPLSLLSPFYLFRYGNQVYADELDFLYGDSRAKGFGSEVHTLPILNFQLGFKMFGSFIHKCIKECPNLSV